MLMNAGIALPKEFELSTLRFLASGDGPPDPKATVWANEVLGLPIHGRWGQAEVGDICGNYASMEVRPGSAGWPVPGVSMAALDCDFKPVGPGITGHIGVRTMWPWSFPLSSNNVSRFRRGWRITGHRGYFDEDGCCWLVKGSEY